MVTTASQFKKAIHNNDLALWPGAIRKPDVSLAADGSHGCPEMGLPMTSKEARIFKRIRNSFRRPER